MATQHGICRSLVVTITYTRLLLLLSCTCSLLAGCTALSMPMMSSLPWAAEKKVAAVDEADWEDKETEDGRIRTIGDYTSIAGMSPLVIHGVGLVNGLDSTGGDPPPSGLRTALLEDMRKREVKTPNMLLQSPSTALVRVQAFIPPLARKGDRIDVRVSLPSGTEATSLAGGWLLPCDLTEQALIRGQGVREGRVLAKAEGPILVSSQKGDESGSEARLHQGLIPGGAVSVREDRHLALKLRPQFRSVRMSKKIADRIGYRFHHFDDYGIRRPLAEAKTDSQIELKLHPSYRDNHARYLQVVRAITFKKSAVEQRVRIAQLREELFDGPTAEQAAIALEAIGNEAVQALKQGLKAELLESRFHAAVALAYLGHGDGVEILAEAAKNEPAFRVFVLAAMTSLDGGEAHWALRELLHESTPELRYGAFRALTTIDPNDPFIAGMLLNDRYTLHVLDTKGDPYVHLTKRQKAEVVLFGADQRMQAPMSLKAGNHIFVAARAGSDRATLSRYQVGQEDQKIDCSLRLSDIILTAAKLGATYPDIAQMLAEAKRQRNLPGEIGIDELPTSGRVYYRPGEDEETEKSEEEADSSRVGVNQVPNIFDAEDVPDE